ISAIHAGAGAIAEEVQSRLADIQTRQGQFTKARRHLKAALAHEPAKAEYHHRLGVSHEEDPEADPHKALAHYSRCIKLDPSNPPSHCDFGFAALAAGRAARGLAALRKAPTLAPDDPKILGQATRGLADAGHEDEARRMVRAAMFRNPRDRRFQQIWQ